MTAITTEDVKVRLDEILATLRPGDAVLIQQEGRTVAELTAVGEKLEKAAGAPRPVFGSCRDLIRVVSEDDEHLVDFREYME